MASHGKARSTLNILLIAITICMTIGMSLCENSSTLTQWFVFDGSLLSSTLNFFLDYESQNPEFSRVHQILLWKANALQSLAPTLTKYTKASLSRCSWSLENQREVSLLRVWGSGPPGQVLSNPALNLASCKSRSSRSDLNLSKSVSSKPLFPVGGGCVWPHSTCHCDNEVLSKCAFDFIYWSYAVVIWTTVLFSGFCFYMNLGTNGTKQHHCTLL